MPDSQEIQERVVPDKVGVFISYNHADLPIANALRQSLIAVSSDLAPFIDHVEIMAGDEYQQKLAQSISASQWFLMIYSGPPRPEKDLGWCLYEAGQFRSKLLEEGSDTLFHSRLIVIHDDQMPSQLAQFQSVQISGKDLYGHVLNLEAETSDKGVDTSFERTPIYSLFETLIRQSRKEPLQDLTDQNVRSLLRTNARALIRAFIKITADAPQVFISYAHEDLEAAINLYNIFKGHRIRPWLDKKDLEIGSVWELEINKAIRKTDFIVICISRRSVNKRGYVQREIKLALDTYQALPMGAAFVMPARLEDCEVPEELSAYQYCDLFAADGPNRLVAAILKHWAKKHFGLEE